MIARCRENRPRYGGRGITVCDRWQSFPSFLEDMGERPEGMEIDRIDNDQGYSKDNCRWATKSQNGRNRSTNRTLIVGSEIMCIADAVERFGVSHSMILKRLNRGWSGDMAVHVPPQRLNGKWINQESSHKSVPYSRLE